MPVNSVRRLEENRTEGKRLESLDKMIVDHFSQSGNQNFLTFLVHAWNSCS